MSDAERRALEQALKAAPDDARARAALRAAEVRDGVRKVFPPRRRVRASERPQDRWCPVCKTWSLRVRSQKERGRRGRNQTSGKCKARGYRDGVRLPKRLDPSPLFERRAKPRRVCDGWLRPPEPEARPRYQMPEPRVTPRPIVPGESFEVQVAWPRETADRIYGTRCPGPAKGQHARPPLEALEQELARLCANGPWSWQVEAIEWFRHRIAVERRRLGVPEPVAPHVCRQRDLDYVPGDRTHVRCAVCGAVTRAQ